MCSKLCHGGLDAYKTWSHMILACPRYCMTFTDALLQGCWRLLRRALYGAGRFDITACSLFVPA
jgi:hypothetical protein